MAETVNNAFMAQPAGSEDPSLGDDRIRAFKLAWKERLEKEHYLDLTEAGTQPRQGLHRAGSAVAFYQASAPTERNGVALGASDAGILWVDSDTGLLYTWSGSAWTAGRGYVEETTDYTPSALAVDTIISMVGTGLTLDIGAGASVDKTLLVIVNDEDLTLDTGYGSAITVPAGNELWLRWDDTTSAWFLVHTRNPLNLHLDTTAGNSSWTAQLSGYLDVLVTGGGGGGGGANCRTSSTVYVRGGGGDAGRTLAVKYKVVAGTAYAYTVGAGGTAGSNSGAAGGTGGTSSFDTGAISIKGGAGGTGALGTYDSGNSDAVYTQSAVAGLNRQFVVVPTGTKARFLTTHFMAANPNSGADNNESGGTHGRQSDLSRSGHGGSSIYGAGPDGVTSTDAVGVNATNPGTGGSGAAEDDTSGRTGGVGAAGAIAVWAGYP